MSILGTRSTRSIWDSIPFVTRTSKETQAARSSLTKAAGAASDPQDRAVVSQDELGHMKYRDIVVQASHVAATLTKPQPAPNDLSALVQRWEDYVFESASDAPQAQSLAKSELRGDAKRMAAQYPGAKAYRFAFEGYFAVGVLASAKETVDGKEVTARTALFDAATGTAIAQGHAYDSPQIYWDNSFTSPTSTLLPVELVTQNPSASLSRAGETYVLRATENAGGAVAPITLKFDNQSVVLNSAWLNNLNQRLPAGYWGTLLDRSQDGNNITTAFRIERIPSSFKSEGELLGLARTALTDFVRDKRMKDSDWLYYFASTWDEFKADGGVVAINSFGSHADSQRITNGRYVSFVDAGPYNLYTEVDIDRVTGEAKRVYVEID